MSGAPRVLVLGLDSVSPWILYERFLSRMPRTKELLARSLRGTLTTVDPPITVPAWAVMFAGVDPGTLGLYGFRHRRPGSYWDQYIPNSRTMRRPLLWDRLSRVGRRVCVIGMPPGYPPPAVNGVYISDFLTPDNAPDNVSPLSMKAEVDRAAGGRYVVDVTFRAEDRDRIAVELTEMTRKRFAVARHLWAKEKWDLFALHEIGPDRLHHTFWKFFDPAHPRFEADSKYRNVADDYYTMLDQEIGQLLDLVPEDVRILIASDHGSQAMQGGFCINDWLSQQGYLSFRTKPAPGTPIEKADIDWSRTRAWGAGGYYARIFYNVKGREPQGIIPPAELADFEGRLSQDLRAIRKPDGSSMEVEVKLPKTVYREVNGDPPDLMVYFAHATWRSAGTVGYPSLYLSENDTGPDDSVHSFEGVYALSGAGSGVGPDQKILDIAPSLMKLLGQPVPKEMQGVPIPQFA